MSATTSTSILLAAAIRLPPRRSLLQSSNDDERRYAGFVGGPGRITRLGVADCCDGQAAALLEGEDDALVDDAAFQLAVGLGGLLHGHGFGCAQAEPAIGQQGDRLTQGTGSTAVGGLGERDGEVRGAGSDKVMTRSGPPARAIASARTPLPAASNTASTAPSADPAGQAGAVPHRRRSQLPGRPVPTAAHRRARAAATAGPGGTSVRSASADRVRASTGRTCHRGAAACDRGVRQRGGPGHPGRRDPAPGPGPSGNLSVCGQQFWLGPQLGGVAITLWMDTTVVHILRDQVRLKTVPSRLTLAHLRQLLAEGGRVAGAPPLTATVAGPIEVDRLVSAAARSDSPGANTRSATT
jgi:hypothetical protein